MSYEFVWRDPEFSPTPSWARPARLSPRFENRWHRVRPESAERFFREFQ